MASLWQDVRFAIRLLARDRTFTIAALLTLAVCIAANTAMFGIVRSVLLKPLPFPDSDRIVLLYNSYPNAGAIRSGASVPDYYDRMASVPALGEVALYRPESMTFGDENGVERLASLRATPSFYRLIGVQPLHGRFFRDDEGERGRALKVILGFAFWQRKFGGNPKIVGQSIRLNGNALDVVGIMPQGFSFLREDVDVYVPSPIGPADKRDDMRHSNNWQMLGHLRPDASVTLVQQQVDAVNAANDRRFPEFHQILNDAQFHTVAVLLKDDVVRDVRAVLYLLWGGVALVLLIGCVNIANLVVVRSRARSGEMAMRHAIGGSVSRLSRQIFTETTLIAGAGGALGTLGGWWTLRSIAALDLDKLPRGYEVRLDSATFVVALTVSVAAGLLLGLAPALGLRTMNLSFELQTDGRASTSSRRANLVRRIFSIVQVAFAFVLLVGAGLLFASFRAVLKLDLGFTPEHVVTATVNLPATSYRDDASIVAFGRRALAGIRAQGEVETAGLVSAVPFSGVVNNNVVLAEGHVMKPGESLLAPDMVIAASGYFETLRIPILRGRTFDDRDHAGASPTVIVDDRLAKRFWPDKDPIGRRMYFPGDPQNISKVTADTAFLTVVGVVKDVQATDPRADISPVGTCYLPFEHAAPRGLTFTIRTRAASAAAFATLRQEISRIDPQLPVFRTRSMQEWINRALVNRRVPMLIAAAFGLVALFLSAVGVYGVLAYNVSLRRREMGVRIALGSSTRGIFTLVMRDGVQIILAGLGLGAAGSLLVGRLMRAELYGVGPMDPLIIAGVAVLLSSIAFVAILIPSWRASTVDPVAVLNR